MKDRYHHSQFDGYIIFDISMFVIILIFAFRSNAISLAAMSILLIRISWVKANFTLQNECSNCSSRDISKCRFDDEIRITCRSCDFITGHEYKSYKVYSYGHEIYPNRKGFIYYHNEKEVL